MFLSSSHLFHKIYWYVERYICHFQCSFCLRVYLVCVQACLFVFIVTWVFLSCIFFSELFLFLVDLHANLVYLSFYFAVLVIRLLFCLLTSFFFAVYNITCLAFACIYFRVHCNVHSISLLVHKLHLYFFCFDTSSNNNHINLRPYRFALSYSQITHRFVMIWWSSLMITSASSSFALRYFHSSLCDKKWFLSWSFFGSLCRLHCAIASSLFMVQ